MGFLDDLKNRLHPQDPEPYGDDGYDDYYDDQAGYDDGYQGSDYGQSQQSYRGSSYGQEEHNGMLGQTRRGEAESVAVYTRSGQLVGDADRHATTYTPSMTPSPRETPAYRPGAYDTPSSYAQAQHSAASVAASASSTSTAAETAARVSAVVNSTPQLPAYVLRPESYDDVETVVRRVRTRQPVALVFVGVRTEVAKRVLDFSYGFACGLGASVRELGDRVFMVLPQDCEVKETDLAKLRADGYLKQ
ncbi:MAG: cell division protein SepF [Coriobacteriaceae bacterium]|nr:cell division protein SepF [Coriobacteriaceae bacterium]